LGGTQALGCSRGLQALVLQALYNLSDDQTEYQLRDRFSFARFLGLGLEDAVFDAKTPWLYREALAKAGAVEELFDGFLKDKGYLAMASAGDSAYREPRKSRKSSPNTVSRAAFIAGPIAIANGAEARKADNTTRSKVRARVEHVFGDQKNGMRAEIVRMIGIVRADARSA
jgi:Transposase domain (DUF772)